MRAGEAPTAAGTVPVPLPIHGFVLVGGQSSRMGQDKALLRLGGAALVSLAVERLREFCAAVSLLGNRADLAGYAEVVEETRSGVGPGAGMEAGLEAAVEPWALFTPVDVPFVPARLLRRWVEATLARAAEGCEASFLRVGEDRQPAFALVNRSRLAAMTAALDGGERRLAALLGGKASEAGGELWIPEARLFAGEAGSAELAVWFRNLNTPAEFAAAREELPG